MTHNRERVSILIRSLVVGAACFTSAIGHLNSSVALVISLAAVLLQFASVRSANSARWGTIVLIAVVVSSSMPFTDPAAAALVGTALFVEGLWIGAQASRKQTA